MCGLYRTLTQDNLASEHLCCAIADKKHQAGVEEKKRWLRSQLPKGHVFRKLDAQGKVFIEYAPLETAWVPIEGANYLYIYCLWVSGKYKGQGHGKALLDFCLAQARLTGRAGICVLACRKKQPFLSDAQFLKASGFTVADTIGEYELLACSLDGSLPRFCNAARAQRIAGRELTVYYSPQCPYILNCVDQVRMACAGAGITCTLIQVDTPEQAKAMPCVFNNWAVFHQGKFQTHHLLNEGYLKKLLDR